MIDTGKPEITQAYCQELLQEILGFQHLSSQEIFSKESEYGPKLFEILPSVVTTVFVGNRMRFDREGSELGQTWQEGDLRNFISSLR